MKNAENYRLIKTIAMELDEFRDLIEKLTNGILTVDYEFGAYIRNTDEALKNNALWSKDIIETLSEHFDTKVTSWHSDTCDYPMVFICYQE